MRRTVLILAMLWAAALPAVAETRPRVPVPPGSRTQPDGQILSSRSFADTVRFYQRELGKRGWSAEVIPTEKFRDTAYMRILARDRSAPFQAIHLTLARGRTTIYIVAP